MKVELANNVYWLPEAKEYIINRLREKDPRAYVGYIHALIKAKEARQTDVQKEYARLIRECDQQIEQLHKAARQVKGGPEVWAMGMKKYRTAEANYKALLKVKDSLQAFGWWDDIEMEYKNQTT